MASSSSRLGVWSIFWRLRYTIGKMILPPAKEGVAAMKVFCLSQSE